MKLPSRRVAGRLLACSVMFLVAGCDTKGCRTDNSSGLPAATLPVTTFGSASIGGSVTFAGTTPEPRVLEESETCGVVMDETLVVATDGGLANVLVYLDGADASTGEGREAAQLDQSGCRFVPRTLAVQVGQELQIVNGDPTRHNVRFAPARNERQNLIFAKGGDRETVVFDRPEAMPFTVKCDIHPWMAASVGVFDHPFFATTDEKGQYAIEQVPAGSYEVVAWHELLGERREAVVVAGDEVASVDFSFARE